MDTLSKNTQLHWRNLVTGYLRVTIFPKKEEVVNKGMGMQMHAHLFKVFEMGALRYPDALLPS